MRVTRSWLALAAAGAMLGVEPAWGWGPGGHMLVAYIAYGRLGDKAKAEVDRLIAIEIDPVPVTRRSLDFVNAAHWPDDLRSKPYDVPFAYSFPLHFVDYPFSTDKKMKMPAGLPEEKNIITALEDYIGVLKTSTDDKARAQALRFVIHFVGDIQQPLHCATLVSAAHPDGDRGGNDFHILLNGRDEKLHSYWDGGVSDFPKGGPPPDYDPPALSEIPPVAARIVAAYPETAQDWREGGTDGFETWAKNASALGRGVAYRNVKAGKAPSKSYNAAAVKIARQQAAWGGYRLAALLNSIWPD